MAHQMDFTDTVTILHDEHRLFGTVPEIAVVAEGGQLTWRASGLTGRKDLRLEIEFEQAGYGLRGPFEVKNKHTDNPARGVYVLTSHSESAMTSTVDVPSDTYWKYRIILRDLREKRILDTLDPGVAIKKKK
ncbi:MAG: hypothetical protein O7A63_10525 [Acidobacteria bacterium]|nr:hypothetical protein [Acidobacteriota bacterium]